MYEELSRTWIDEWLLGKVISNVFQDLKLPEEIARRGLLIVRFLTGCQGWYQVQTPEEQLPYPILKKWLQDPDVQRFIGVNRHQDILWFKKEAFEEFLWWVYLQAVVEIGADIPDLDGAQRPAQLQQITACYGLIESLLEAEKLSDYQVEKLLSAAKKQPKR